MTDTPFNLNKWAIEQAILIGQTNNGTNTPTVVEVVARQIKKAYKQLAEEDK